MWVTVIKKFKDKDTKEIREPGQKFNLSKNRVQEIMAAGPYIKVVEKE